MASKPRDEATYACFLVYLDEIGLIDELRAICRAHHVSLRDIYLDARGPTSTAARMQAWWWLVAVKRKSQSEVARMFDRDDTSIGYAVRKLCTQSRVMNVELTEATVERIARAFGEQTAENLRASGAAAQPLANRKRVIKRP